MRRLVRPVAGALGVALVLAGCAGSDRAGSTSAQGSSRPSASSTLDPNGMVDEDTERTITPEPVPSWDAQSREAALRAATLAMTRFARPDLEYDQWWRDLTPLLTQQAQQDYRYVDPANIPVRKVASGAAVSTPRSAYTATVTVPTDVGSYSVLLIRQDGAAPWLVSRFTPPQGLR